jgi:hypothetical protein
MLGEENSHPVPKIDSIIVYTIHCVDEGIVTLKCHPKGMD